MSDCPVCGVVLQHGDGPHGLAFHGCVPAGSETEGATIEERVRRLIEQAVTDPALDPKGAAIALARATILRQFTDGPEGAAVALKALGGQKGAIGALAEMMEAEKVDGSGDNGLADWVKGAG